jgi:translin
MEHLETIIDNIMEYMEGQNAARDTALTHTRKLVRMCSNAIRAVHRQEWENADVQLTGAKAMLEQINADLQPYPELYYSGMTQDAMREYAEAHLTYALIRGNALPTPQELGLEPATYLNGLAEAATELRRYILDILRHQHNEESEALLDSMDTIYSHLITVDFTDAITKGLRHRTDIVRNVLEKTRGDITTSLRQQQLQDALNQHLKEE